MPVKIGIDIGSSTTKIVAFEGEHMLPPMAVKADSQVASLYGAFGRYLYENNLELADVEGVYITGVGSKYVEKAVYDRPTYKVDEFVATGTGGYYLTDKKEVRSGSLASVLYRMLWIKCLADGLELWKCIWK